MKTNEKQLAVYEMNFDCGRMGKLEGIFVADKRYVDFLVSNNIEIYFGEVLGKHSEVYGTLTPDEIKMVSDNPEVVSVVKDNGLSSGYNPFEYGPNGWENEALDDLQASKAFSDGLTIGEAIAMILD